VIDRRILSLVSMGLAMISLPLLIGLAQAFTVHNPVSSVQSPLSTVFIPTYTPAPAATATCPASGDQIIAVLGIDERDDNYVGFNTDAIWLVRFTGNALRALALPRDLVAAYPPGVGFEEQRVNWAWYLGEKYQYVGGLAGDQETGGFGLLRDVLAVNYGIRPAHYVLVDFRAFVDAVDALGGVEVDVPERVQDDRFPEDFGFGYQTVTFEPGPQHMDGLAALRYARVRHGDGDDARSGRQRQLLEALRERLVEPGLWPRLPAAVENLMQSGRTNLALDQVFSLACLASTQSVQFILVDEQAAPSKRESSLGDVRRPVPALFDELLWAFSGP